MKNGGHGSDGRTRRTEPERGYGWLAAVVPTGARRFRVADPALAAELSDAGADLVASAPDVEIAPVSKLRGDAAVSITLLGQPGRHAPLPARVVRRLVNSGRVRLAAWRAGQAVSRLGYPAVTVLTWDYHRTPHDPRVRRKASRADLADYFPQRALVVGRARPHESTLVDAVLMEANSATGGGLQANGLRLRTEVRPVIIGALQAVNIRRSPVRAGSTASTGACKRLVIAVALPNTSVFRDPVDGLRLTLLRQQAVFVHAAIVPSRVDWLSHVGVPTDP